MKNCMPLWRQAHFQVKMLQNWGPRPLLEVGTKWHETVAGSTFATIFGGTDVEKRSYIHRHRYIAS